eukprot:CAMPEP_0116008966 /NCGR_PEP_ID=MMETSP0321-20121206/3166_1 /TAXON_ID=163516 /ORGANISM="Leptocylindrus danicus var. danicus, Strain B650" /LENGTH=288 /DNA_ID=CAMNT_0003477867 /DNA_START=1 /DNA_END=867 /DNA_ORIENTATION=-
MLPTVKGDTSRGNARRRYAGGSGSGSAAMSRRGTPYIAKKKGKNKKQDKLAPLIGLGVIIFAAICLTLLGVYFIGGDRKQEKAVPAAQDIRVDNVKAAGEELSDSQMAPQMERNRMNMVMRNPFYRQVDYDMDGNKVQMSVFNGFGLVVGQRSFRMRFNQEKLYRFVKLVDEFGDRGLKVLAFPSNQFGGQEPGTHDEILAFAEEHNARDKFTFFEKADVNGPHGRSLYLFLEDKLPSANGSKDIEWNFSKFLVDHNGIPYKRYGPRVNPLPDIKADIEYLLSVKEEV